MIGYLKGNLIWADQRNVILSVNGVGYEINFYNNFVISDYGSELTLFINRKISEYGEALFGFSTIDEKIVFETLETIKGVGSKVIFTIMSELEVKSFSDLKDLNLDKLVKLPGVGKSTAQKFLLALSNKLKKEFELENKEISKNDMAKYKAEIDVLVDLGLRKADLHEFIKQNIGELEGKTSDKIIQYILKNI